MQKKPACFACAGFLLLTFEPPAYAQPAPNSSWMRADQGKILLTAGFADAEGAAGGGLVPWALITGYGSRDSFGANAHLTTVQLPDFDLKAYGVGVGLFDRVELSYTKHELDVTGTALDGLGVKQDIFGLKLRLLGDAVYSQDLWIPQVAVGAEYKKNNGLDDGGSVGNAALVNPKQLGADDDRGVDYYLSATKVFLAQSFLVNATVRYTNANQFGLLGFGGDRETGRSWEPEVTAAYLFNRRTAVGVEYRSKPENLSVDTEEDAWDAFVAWAPTKNLSLVAAYLNLGSILGPVTGSTQKQDGLYLSFQAGF